jgi:CheY-like chemotaxis protein/predicted regulator of Ras-like GTPase activity (Roadblock/LC7/MglB family)
MGAAPGAPGAPETSAQRVWRVLVVDDEENLNWSLVTSLRKDTYAADGALTGEDALRRLAAQHYDIVISDVKMPGMDGFELLQWLRSHRPQTRVLIMTAFGSPTDRSEALRAGAVAYLEKPFDLRALKEELRRLTATPAGQQMDAQAEPEGYDLLDVARVINLARRDMALLVQSQGRTGRLRFLRGDLIWAEAGELAGDEAFVALTAPRSGQVQPEPWDGRSARNVTQPLGRLAYLALQQRDRTEMGGPTRPASAGSPAPADQNTSPGSRLSNPPAPAPSSTPAATPTGSISTPSFTPPMSAAPPTATPSTAPTFTPSAGTGELAGRSGIPLPSTAPLSPLSPAQAGAARAVLDQLASKLPESAGVALIRPDGLVVAQRWVGTADASPGTLAHLASCAQGAMRALLLGGWGDLDVIQITSQERSLLLRRLNRTDRAVVLVVVAPRDADPEAWRAAVHEQEEALVDALR